MQGLAEAVGRSPGHGGEPKPAYLDFPVDGVNADFSPAVQLAWLMVPRPVCRLLPDPAAVSWEIELLWSAKRPLVISASNARGDAQPLRQPLDCVGELYLDAGNSRGLVSDDHPSGVK